MPGERICGVRDWPLDGLAVRHANRRGTRYSRREDVEEKRPFTLTNVVVGASTIHYRDFIVGTALGMTAFVVGLAGFGYQLSGLLREPSADKLLGAALFVLVPLTIAMAINHALRRTRPAD